MGLGVFDSMWVVVLPTYWGRCKKHAALSGDPDLKAAHLFAPRCHKALPKGQFPKEPCVLEDWGSIGYQMDQGPENKVACNVRGQLLRRRRWVEELGSLQPLGGEIRWAPNSSCSLDDSVIDSYEDSERKGGEGGGGARLPLKVWIVDSCGQKLELVGSLSPRIQASTQHPMPHPCSSRSYS